MTPNVVDVLMINRSKIQANEELRTRMASSNITPERLHYLVNQATDNLEAADKAKAKLEVLESRSKRPNQ